jgi:hypothetical protein
VISILDGWRDKGSVLLLANGAAELREIAGGRDDILAEAAVHPCRL